MRCYLLFIKLLICSIAIAQIPAPRFENIDINNISARFLSNGMIAFNSIEQSSHFEFPKGDSINGLAASSIWIEGYDDTNQLRLAAHYYNNGNDYFFGPIANSYDTTYNQRYNHVWKINASNIASHIASYQTLGYIVPTDIATWPGNGDVSNGEADKLAPYQDVNGDGIYNPALGDYPLILGDQALYMIYNDHSLTNGLNLGVEIHQMVYAFTDTAVENTIFINQRIYNKGQNNLHDVKLGWWNDFEIGNFYNDVVGCDTTLNLFFAYNGNEYDVNNGNVKGYDSSNVTLGAIYLNTKMESFLTYFDGANFPFSNLVNDTDFSGYMNCLSQNNVPLCYVFPGDPCSTNEWIDTLSVPITSGDRRGLGSSIKYNLPQDSMLSIDMAYTFAVGDPADSCLASGVTALKQNVPLVKNFYLLNKLGAQSPILSIGNVSSSKWKMNCFPNPAQDKVRIESSLLEDKEAIIRLFDIQGRVLLEQETLGVLVQQIDVSLLQRGIYFIAVETPKNKLLQKIVLQ